MAIAPYVLGGLSAYALIRAVFRPHKALVAAGSVESCEGQASGCMLAVRTAPADPVFATAPSIVVSVGASFVHLMARNEPVVLDYEGIKPSVKKGDEIGSGQQIGTSPGVFRFGAIQLGPKGALGRLSPSAWLASRGYRVADKILSTRKLWCEGGRTIAVPQADGKACGFLSPEPGGFALLPIKVSVER